MAMEGWCGAHGTEPFRGAEFAEVERKLTHQRTIHGTRSSQSAIFCRAVIRPLAKLDR
jgi:hypothetical protein